MRKLTQAELAQLMQKREEGGFEKLGASELYCPKCKRAMPVREKMLLTLPGGDLYDFVCTGCGESLGTRR